jgi:hypothetical protein
MSAPSSRREAGVREPRAKRELTFRIVIDSQEIMVVYKPNWMPDMAHFEFRSPHEPRRPIPFSETGYRSHFADMAEVNSFPSPQDYARDTALEYFNALRKPPDDDQLAMF